MGVAEITRILKRGVHRGLRRLGWDLVRYGPVRFPELARGELLRSQGVDLVLDVGANTGVLAQSVRAGGYGGRIVSFEPSSAAFAELAATAAGDAAWDVRRLALGATAGEVTLNLAGNSSSSSLLPMTSLHVESAPESAYVATETVELATLDSLREELVRPGDRVYLKLDVQGFELEVVKGAADVLPQVHVVDAELSLVPLYEGAPRLHEVVDVLAAHHFVLRSLSPVFSDPHTGQLLQVDGLFTRANP
jgi:FkbM family methyltransferase